MSTEMAMSADRESPLKRYALDVKRERVIPDNGTWHLSYPYQGQPPGAKIVRHSCIQLAKVDLLVEIAKRDVQWHVYIYAIIARMQLEEAGYLQPNRMFPVWQS